MRACVLNRPASIDDKPLRLVDVPTPRPAPGSALIRVACCGVCRTDLHVIEGELDQARQKSPVIPGHQIVGEIVELNDDVDGNNQQPTNSIKVGDHVGVAWLHDTCGTCRFCQSQRENLCDDPTITGWTVDGGYAEYVTAPIDFLYPIPEAFIAGGVERVAPLLCAGIIGYRCLHMTGITAWRGRRLGIYGFGAAGHIAIQLAIARGAEVYVCTRDRERHQALAEELGATWVGGTVDRPPVPLDASIIFAPAGDIVPPSLAALDKGGDSYAVGFT